MSTDKEKDFWSSSNDDFWNKPVVSDDWLKSNDSDSIWNSTDSVADEEQKEEVIESNPYLQTSSATESNPYLQTSSTTENNPYADDNSWYYNPYENRGAEPTASQTVNSDQVYAQITGKAPVKKRVHMHTIICLSFLALAVISFAVAIIASSRKTEEAAKQVTQVTYKEEAVGNSFFFYDNNEVILEDTAYTVVSEKSFTGFPEDQKLIAVYVEVKSEDYKYESAAFRHFCIGYQFEDVTVYKKPVREDLVSPFIMSIGFRTDQLLSTYGIGNGTDYAGYYFFFVPSDVETFTLYMEKKKEQGMIEVVDTIYYKEYTVLPESEELTKELTGREAD